jgi:hypothetical protein
MIIKIHGLAHGISWGIIAYVENEAHGHSNIMNGVSISYHGHEYFTP